MSVPLIQILSSFIFYIRNTSNAHTYSARCFLTLHRVRALTLAISFLFIISLWLYPIHKAWMLSKQGFEKLAQNDTQGFTSDLSKAHHLAPWEAYYTYQLGWNLGELAYKQQNTQKAKQLQADSVRWFETAIASSPHREFGYSNLGWLLVNTDPKKAIRSFVQASQLMPRKKGAYFALGYGLLRAGKVELSIQAMLTELLSNPALTTSPIWQSEELESISSTVFSRLHASCNELINSEIPNDLKNYFHHIRGGLNWWQGNFSEAEKDLSHISTPGLTTLLSLTRGNKSLQAKLSSQPLHTVTSASDALIIAWLKPESRPQAIHRALLLSNLSDFSYSEDSLKSTQEEILQSINTATSFHEWLTALAPTHQLRNQRLGFGVISRHIDGPIPQDFSPRLENLLFTQFFSLLLPNQASSASLEKLLEPMRASILKQIEEQRAVSYSP